MAVNLSNCPIATAPCCRARVRRITETQVRTGWMSGGLSNLIKINKLFQSFSLLFPSSGEHKCMAIQRIIPCSYMLKVFSIRKIVISRKILIYWDSLNKQGYYFLSLCFYIHVRTILNVGKVSIKHETSSLLVLLSEPKTQNFERWLTQV